MLQIYNLKKLKSHRGDEVHIKKAQQNPAKHYGSLASELDCSMYLSSL